MTIPTPQQIEQTLAEAVGARRPYTHEASQSCYVEEVNDRRIYFEIDSLDSMAIVEAHIYRSPQDYQVYYALREQLAIKAWKFDYSPTMNQLRCAVDVQPASVRALAAYQVLKGKERTTP